MSSTNNISFPDFPPDLTQQIVRLQGDDGPIAGGAFADIWRCIYHHPLGSKQVAIKVFRRLRLLEHEREHPQISLDVMRELEIWRRLDHPNVLPFLGITTGFSPFISLVSEWMPNGSLGDFLARSRNNASTVSIGSRLQILVDIASGLEYLHSLPVIHGNLTPTNILIDENRNALLSGFGRLTVPELIAERIPYLRADSESRQAGSIRFMPPELVQEELTDIGPAIDIFSLGCNGILVLSGQMPWSEYHREAQILLRLYNGEVPARPSSVPVDDLHWQFLQSCWSKVQDRPSASEAFLAFYTFLTSLAE